MGFLGFLGWGIRKHTYLNGFFGFFGFWSLQTKFRLSILQFRIRDIEMLFEWSKAKQIQKHNLDMYIC